MTANMTPPQTPAPLGPPPLYDRDAEHLKLLAIFWYIWGGLLALGGCFSLFYVVLGVVMVAAPPADATQDPNGPPPEVIGGIFAAVGAGLLVLLLCLGGLAVMVGRSLATQRRRTFCLVMSAVSCLSIPLGTVLGVFTLVVLGRPTVEAMFARQRVAARTGV